jgi:Zn-dependent protease
MPEFSRELTWPARQALAAAASGKLSSSWHPADRVLAALLGDQGCDAVHTLVASGHEPARLLDDLRHQAASSPARASFVPDSLQPDDVDSPMVGAAQREAEGAGALTVTTRDLLVAALQQPAPGALAIQQGVGIDLALLRQLPVQVYEPLVKPEPVPRARSRLRFPISLTFVGLVALTAGAGIYLYLAPAPDQMGVFVFVTAGWMVSLSLHEFGHALAAYFGGDRSVVERGYLTLDPLKYTNPFLSIVMPVVFLVMGGIGLPGGSVYIDSQAIRSRVAYTLVSASGPLANLICAVVLAVPFFVTDPELQLVHMEFWSGLAFLIMLQVSAILFNLIPIPGLDGFAIVAPWLPDTLLQFLLPFAQFGFFILFFLFWRVEQFQEWFWGQVFATMYQINVDPLLGIWGSELYRFWM